MKKLSSRGFTLVELLVVISIVGILFSVGAISYSSILKGSRDAKRKADLEQIRAAMEMYRSDSATASYPTAGTCAILGPLINTYLPTFPSDPKSGSSYSCTSSSTSYTLYSTLEGGTYTSCGGSCGTTCEYAVNPYGKICGP